MKPVTVLCIFRVKDGEVAPFEDLLRIHWPTLHAAGMVTDDPAQQWKSRDREGRPVIVEMLTWKDASMAERAHQTPEVMAVWEPMGEHCEERPGQMAMEFLDLDPLPLGDAD